MPSPMPASARHLRVHREAAGAGTREFPGIASVVRLILGEAAVESGLIAENLAGSGEGLRSGQ